KPETSDSESPAPTGIDYLTLTAAAHHEQLRGDERIGYHALYGDDGQIPGQLSLDDVDDLDHEGGVSL
ncbi:MAG: transposase, partial [Mycobacterium sp.]